MTCVGTHRGDVVGPQSCEVNDRMHVLGPEAGDLEENKTDQDGVKMALIVLAVMAPLPPLSAALIGNPVFGVGVFSLLFAVGAALCATKAPDFAKPVMAGVLLLQTMALTTSFAGHPWQIDTHMLYFAVLAVISVMYDVRVLFGAAAFIAVHHLGVGLAVPVLLYPDTSDGAIGHTLFHAAVVVLETIILALSIQQKHAIAREVQAQSDEVLELNKASQAAEQAAHEGKRAATEVMHLLAQHLNMLAEQDMSQTIDRELPTQYEDLRIVFNTLVETLGGVLQTATETSADFGISSKELSGAAEDLAQRTEVQSATLSNTAERLQELSKTLQETANGASQANETAAITQSSAQKNGDIVEQAVSAMQRITESSGEISNIISLIEDIAFQTNLLALNAGVEAARAGESGLGFAVVASEVRALAQRTSEAASSVKQLIDKSAQEVEKGSGLVNAAGKALGDIVVQAADASAMIGTITESVNSQADVVQNLNQAVQSLDTATQHNAAMCEEMTAMGQQLANGSNTLTHALSGFRFERKNVSRMAG